MQNFALSETFGWTPEQIKKIDELDKMKYISILSGRGKAKPKNG